MQLVDWILLVMPALAALLGTGLLSRHTRKKVPALVSGASTRILSAFDKPGSFGSIREVADAHIDEFLKTKLPQEMPVVGMFVGDKTIDQLKSIFMKELEQIFPIVMRQYINGITTPSAPSAQAENPILQNDNINRPIQSAIDKLYLPAALLGLFTGLIQVGIAHLLR